MKDRSQRTNITQDVVNSIETLVNEHWHLTLREIKLKSEKDCENFSISLTSVNRALQILIINMKKFIMNCIK